MNQNAHYKILSFTIILLLISFKSIDSFASDNTHNIYLTGKITNTDFGIPVANHKIYVMSESLDSRNTGYYKILHSDEQGFYYDTLTSSLSDGVFQVYTYDGNDEMQEKKLYFRFMEREKSNNIFVADFSIYMPQQPYQIQANFSYVQNDEENRFSYQFNDLTNSENVSEWHWNFGDGNESEERNPEHVFQAAGLYKVELTVLIVVDGNQEFSSSSKYVYVTATSYFHLGGHCFAGYFPIDKGQAYLYYIDEYQKFIPIDTASFDTLGYYFFYAVPEGEYCIKVQPESTSEFYGNMLPTYFGDTIYWETATHINHHATNWEYDIHLVKAENFKYGICSISGNVAFGDTLANSRNLSAEGIDFLLLNENGDALSSRYSDENGYFIFEELETGIYWLTADIPGYERKSKLVELTDENPHFSNPEIIIENGDINMAVENGVVSINNSLKKLYPNPASDNIKIEISSEASGQWAFEIFSSQGKKMQGQTVELSGGNSIVNLNISKLINGQYILVVKNEGNTTVRSFIVNNLP